MFNDKKQIICVHTLSGGSGFVGTARPFCGKFSNSSELGSLAWLFFWAKCIGEISYHIIQFNWCLYLAPRWLNNSTKETIKLEILPLCFSTLSPDSIGRANPPNVLLLLLFWWSISVSASLFCSCWLCWDVSWKNWSNRISFKKLDHFNFPCPIKHFINFLPPAMFRFRLLNLKHRPSWFWTWKKIMPSVIFMLIVMISA